MDQNSIREGGFKKGLEKGEKSAKNAANKNGIKETTQKIAKEFLKLNVDIEKIIVATGLTKEEIEELKKEES